MFLERILDTYTYQLLLEKYDIDYVEDINRSNFLSIYKLFINNNFYFVNDLVLNYLEIFKLDYDIILESVERFKDNYDNYVYVIGNDLSLFIDMINDVLKDNL